MQATLKRYRQAPRKVRLVSDMVKGKRVSQALTELEFLTKKASDPLAKLIQSAVANARQKDESASADNLIVENITVDKGITFKRYKPRARGRATAIHKETSHVTVTLSEAGESSKTKKEAKASEGAEDDK